MSIALILEACFNEIWNSIVGGMQESLQQWDTKALTCCKQTLMGHSGENEENQNSERYAQ